VDGIDGRPDPMLQLRRTSSRRGQFAFGSANYNSIFAESGQS
jgi:hypothetical protein